MQLHANDDSMHTALNTVRSRQSPREMLSIDYNAIFFENRNRYIHIISQGTIVIRDQVILCSSPNVVHSVATSEEENQLSLNLFSTNSTLNHLVFILPLLLILHHILCLKAKS